MPELRHLRYFVAVAEELNFSRAAKRLHMAQPPLSATIRQLEQELGTALFVRTTREVRLKEPGRLFLDGARRTLAEADRAVAAARRAGAGELGRLSVAFSWGARFETLPAIGQAFRARHPDVELLAQEMWNVSMIPALQSGAVDVAVALCPEPAPGVASEVIRSERLVTLLAASHPLADADAIALDRLADEAFVLFPRAIAPRLYDALIDVCRRAGFEPKLRSEALHTIWTLGVAADVPLVGLACESVATDLPPGVVAVPLTEPAETLETCLLWREHGAAATVEPFRSVARAVYEGRAMPRATRG
jgi:DNA-binding transcriptional LysR family regulator